MPYTGKEGGGRTAGASLSENRIREKREKESGPAERMQFLRVEHEGLLQPQGGKINNERLPSRSKEDKMRKKREKGRVAGSEKKHRVTERGRRIPIRSRPEEEGES